MNSNEKTLPKSTAGPPEAESTVKREVNGAVQRVQDVSEGEKNKPLQEVTLNNEANVTEENGSVSGDRIKKGERDSGEKKEETTQSENQHKNEETKQSEVEGSGSQAQPKKQVLLLTFIITQSFFFA